MPRESPQNLDFAVTGVRSYNLYTRIHTGALKILRL